MKIVWHDTREGSVLLRNVGFLPTYNHQSFLLCGDLPEIAFALLQGGDFLAFWGSCWFILSDYLFIPAKMYAASSAARLRRLTGSSAPTSWLDIAGLPSETFSISWSPEDGLRRFLLFFQRKVSNVVCWRNLQPNPSPGGLFQHADLFSPVRLSPLYLFRASLISPSFSRNLVSRLRCEGPACARFLFFRLLPW